MQQGAERPTSNRLLSELAPEDFEAVASALERFDFAAHYPFATANEVMDSAFFLVSGIASIVVRSPEGQQTEGGVIGREGFIIPALVMGSDRSPHTVQAQIAGVGYRISRVALLDALDRRPALRDRLIAFAHVMAVQLSFTLLSNAVHQIDERLARWLLMCHDRSDSDDVPLTHEFMSLMLAVRRPSVTTALHVLEGNGLIRSERGFVQILNRKKLEDFAGDAYGRPEIEYDRLLGSQS